jgi:hypothetical protein
LATTSPLQAFAIPQASDSPDGATQMTNLAKAVEQRVVMVFASAAARTSAFTAAGISPANGMLCYRTDGGNNPWEYYNATAGAWRVFGTYRDSSTLGASAASVTFSNIPTYLNTLRIAMTARGDTANVLVNVYLRIGGDSTSGVYKWSVRYLQNASTVGQNVMIDTPTSALVGYVAAANSTAGRFGQLNINVNGWNSPHAGCLTGSAQGGYADGSGNSILCDSTWHYSGVNAYTSVTISPAAGNWVSGSQFVLTGTE